MAEKRSKEDVQKAYTIACTQLGDISYKILCLTDAQRKLHNECRDLDKELSRIQAQAVAESDNKVVEVVNEP